MRIEDLRDQVKIRPLGQDEVNHGSLAVQIRLTSWRAHRQGISQKGNCDRRIEWGSNSCLRGRHDGRYV